MKWLSLSETKNAASGNSLGVSDDNQKMPPAQQARTDHRASEARRLDIRQENTLIRRGASACRWTKSDSACNRCGPEALVFTE